MVTLPLIFYNVAYRGWGAEFVDEAHNVKPVGAIAKCIAQKRREAWATTASSAVTFNDPFASSEEPLTHSTSASVEACAWGLNGCLRYRVVLPPGQYAAAVVAAREELTHAGVGLDPSASRNFWREREIAIETDISCRQKTVHSNGTIGLPRIDGRHTVNGSSSSSSSIGRLSGARMGGGVRDVLLVACANSPTGHLRVEVQYHTAASWAWLAASGAQMDALQAVPPPLTPPSPESIKHVVDAALAQAKLEELYVLWREEVARGQHVPLPPGALGLDYAARSRKTHSVRHRCNPLVLSLAAQKVYTCALKARDAATAWVQEACLAAGLGPSCVVHGGENEDEDGKENNGEVGAAPADPADPADPASNDKAEAITAAPPAVKVHSVLLSLEVVHQRLLDASSRLQQATCSDNPNGDFSLDALLAAAAKEVDDVLTISVILPHTRHTLKMKQHCSAGSKAGVNDSEVAVDLGDKDRWAGQIAQPGDAAATLALRAVLLLPPRTEFMKDTAAGSSSTSIQIGQDCAKESENLSSASIVRARIPSHQVGGVRGGHGLMRLSFTLDQPETNSTDNTGDGCGAETSTEPSMESVDSAWRALQRYVREEGRRQTRALFSSGLETSSRSGDSAKGNSTSGNAITPHSFAKSLVRAGVVEASTKDSVTFPSIEASGDESVPPSTAQIALAHALLKKVGGTRDGLSVETLLDALSNDRTGTMSLTSSSAKAQNTFEENNKSMTSRPTPYHPFFMVCVHTQASYTKQKLVNLGKEAVLASHTGGQRERALEKVHSWERNGLPVPPAENAGASVNEATSASETAAAEAGEALGAELGSKEVKQAPSLDNSDGEVEYARGVASFPVSSGVASPSSSSGSNHARPDFLSVRWFRAAVAKGHLGAAVQLGFLCRVSSFPYSNGNAPGSHMIDQDAMWCFLLAAEHGHAEACFHMGLCYAQGRGVEQRESDAELWFRRAAAADPAPSPLFSSLGHAGLPSRSPHPFSSTASLCYFANEAASRAEVNVAIAAAAAIEGAARCRRLAELTTEGHQQPLAFSGDPCSQHELGLRYLQGRGVVQRDTDAVKWLRMAAAHLETSTTTAMTTVRVLTMTASSSDKMAITQKSRTAHTSHDATTSAGPTSLPLLSNSRAISQWPSANDVLAAASGTAVRNSGATDPPAVTATAAPTASTAAAAAGARERQRLGVDLPGDSLLLAADALVQRRAEVNLLKEKLSQVQKNQVSQTKTLPPQGLASSPAAPNAQLLAATAFTTTQGAPSPGASPLENDDQNSLKSFNSLRLTRDPRMLAAAAAAASLGHLCREGRGNSLPREEQDPVRWFRLAAEHGHAEACFHMGLCYAQGGGREGDDSNGGEANIWFEHAAALVHAQLEEDDSRSQQSVDTQPCHRGENNRMKGAVPSPAREERPEATTSPSKASAGYR